MLWANPSVSGEAKIVVFGNLTVQRAVVDSLELEVINRINFVAEAL